VRSANDIATWVTIFSVVIGGSIWVGALSAEVDSTKHSVVESRTQIDKLRSEGPPAIARLEEQSKAIQKDVDEIKRSQEEILREIRKK
jgi:hypothetical protein